MKFGETPLEEAEGAILAHAVRIEGVTLRKGDVITPPRKDALAQAGVRGVVVARLDDSDIGEDAAARLLAERIRGPNARAATAFTGRVNLFADVAGLAIVDRRAIDRVNRVDEAITVATLPPFRRVAEGDMIATVKIIPFAVPSPAVEEALAALATSHAVSVAPFRPLSIAVVSTVLPGLKASVIAKTIRALEARLSPTGARIASQDCAAHAVGPLAGALKQAVARAEAIIVFGASAITDRRDVIPAAIETIGGRIEHFGMPVDPGNLLLLASCGGRTIIGAPGCARSPKENGFDWILQRVIACVPATGADIRAMGVGGLLMEIASRPQPRDPDA